MHMRHPIDLPLCPRTGTEDSKVKLNLQEKHSKNSLGDDWFKYLASESRTRDYPAQLQTVDARGELEVGGRG